MPARLKPFQFLALLLPLWLCAQHILPPIQNYRTFDYHAASKNWGLAANEAGEIFVANNKGLLHFNGEGWTLYELPDRTVIRSVAYIDAKVYTGSYEEFGYWEKDATGVLQYTSLTHLIKEHKFTSEEFWQILSYNDSILFRSFSGIYQYKDDDITIIDSDLISVNIALYEGRLVVAADGGFYLLENEELVRIKDLGLLDGKTIIDMVPTPEGFLIGTKLNGCYLYRNDRVAAWDAPINAELKAQQLNRILPLNDHKIAFGTIKNGIYLYDLEREASQHLNRETGLQNNTVLALLQFKDQLWAGLDNGISRINLDAPITSYTDYSGVVGTVYDLALFQGTLYMGSNTGIYYFEDDRLHFLQGSQGHVWDLEILEGELLAGHNTGTFRIEKATMDKISDISGGYQFAKVPENGSTYLQGTYTGMARYQKNAAGKWQVKRVAGIDFPVNQLCFETPRTLWAAHPYRGLYRMTIDPDYGQIMEKQKIATDALPSNFNIKLYKIKNQIVIQSGGRWHKYDPILDEITDFEEFRPYDHMRLVHHDRGYFWFIDSERSKELISTDLKKDSLAIAEPLLKKRMVPDTEAMVKINDSIYLLSLVDGFGRIDLNGLKQHLRNTEILAPKLAFFRDGEKRHPLTDSIFQVPNGNTRNIRIQVTAPESFRSRYRYALKGPENRSAYTDTGTIDFQNLPHGSYTLLVATLGRDNGTSPIKEIRFEIAPPWYLSWWSLLIYTGVLIATIFIVREYHRRKLRREQVALKRQMHREEQERSAAREKQKLEQEIMQKQKELARTTLNIAKKNELILELKDMLALNKKAFSNQRRYHSLQKKLEASLDGDADWKYFEINFKELHGDFFEGLLRQFPKLTPKDLKLCAYLKMNLSSKEIAPLMGISTRGVEIHRYRLRKKLNMEKAQNLSRFLIQFS
ncbi:LuxR C-terminal-related transcriptional regulator [Pricia sp. S334]|uniref:LuxR C-terminal-related transcriptional regulator n=1 Tax=Pricia mediterranea TaxID=3076079 RepID=A0ABU3L7N5_9FLAO|nr:LuxR C-terminal-related transcriptional regulator [Pricia sp. S334]MDT7829378.1 LuxR C-terminal-related transcriptional regulator [Pricia sp. S334]